MLDWKNLTDELPNKNVDIIARLNVSGVNIWFIGTYLNYRPAIHPLDISGYIFNGSKFNPQFYTKGHRQDLHVADTDLASCFWDYYETKWPVPTGFEDIEEVFYKS